MLLQLVSYQVKYGAFDHSRPLRSFDLFTAAVYITMLIYSLMRLRILLMSCQATYGAFGHGTEIPPPLLLGLVHHISFRLLGSSAAASSICTFLLIRYTTMME
jgi:hypothetical protein